MELTKLVKYRWYTSQKNFGYRLMTNYIFFKRSQYKAANDTKLAKGFTYEFWNEIIAYELSSMFGFNMLRYDIAIRGKY